MNRLPGWGAAAGAALVGVGAVALPDAWFEAAVQASGIAALLRVAEPPLGATARAVLALGGGGVAAAVAWAALYLLFGRGGLFAARAPAADGAPTVRRADAHPDAPPRRPLSLSELSESALSLSAPVPIGRAVAPVPAIPVPMAGPLARDVPADLGTPLSALDPAAIPPVPREPVRAVAPLAPGERLQTFALTPPPPPRPPAAVGEPPSIDALLRRLERGAEQKEGRR